eukprot:tig00000523_g1862.t1
MMAARGDDADDEQLYADDFLDPLDAEDTDDESPVVVQARVLQQAPGEARTEPAEARESSSSLPPLPPPREAQPSSGIAELISALEVFEGHVHEAKGMEQSIEGTFATAEELVNQLAADLRSALRDCQERCQRSLQGCIRSQTQGLEAERALLQRMRAERAGLDEAAVRLEAERTHLRRLVDEYEMEKLVTQQANGWHEDKVVLNIGGRRFETSKSTLTRLSDTFFGCLLGGNFAVKREADGAVFVDRDGTCFEYVLNYLRDGTDAVLPDDPHVLQRLEREAKFYQLSELEALLRDRIARLAHGSPTPGRHTAPRPAPLPEGYRRGCRLDPDPGMAPESPPSPPSRFGGPFESALQALARGPALGPGALPGWLASLEGLPPGHVAAVSGSAGSAGSGGGGGGGGGRLGLRGPPFRSVPNTADLSKGRPAWM